MLRNLKALAAGVVVCLLLPAGLSAQMKFDKVEGRTAYGGAEEGNKGKLIVDGDLIRFVKKNERDEYFSIPSDAVTDVFYSRVSGRRIKTAIFITRLPETNDGDGHQRCAGPHGEAQLPSRAAPGPADGEHPRGLMRANLRSKLPTGTKTLRDSLP